ncbi:MAG TPA: penicillin-binding transpeptidase domain-containing protein [Leptospiraceae bacterium]|nr:penicillin-binding transpeptidase domain-containing protein [Leptospiraceae bacterium]HMW04153.1 penicillin-binding transpeptidase domain-containing protein [Leptospiraceae bacterium]HMX34861.1 penicillin-binding transpeptidase domain-containing protein [Leptospiraceae bacterium]HMY30146.1 penicillin-binding transpeptidase domain-containing protein [Leptospiraceae bacterium]HMZ64347.1 penicillin-binding transpeptidase domain-containing protein [Leptospiraceae bacterium]
MHKFIIICFFSISFSLFGFDEVYLNQIIKEWEESKKNSAIVLITNPFSGRIEFVYNAKDAFYKKLPPGSILKPLSALTLLSQNDTKDKDTSFICKGKFWEPKENFFTRSDYKNFNILEDKESGKKYLKCSTEAGHGEINLREAISYSCNVFFLTKIFKSKNLFYSSFVRDWNLFEGTGASFERISVSNFNDKIPNSPLESMLSGIGEDGKIKVTALKVAQIFGAIFANTPFLKPIQKGETPEQVYPFPYSEKYRNIILQGLREAVKNGTLSDINLIKNNVQILGGKTGSPTREGKKYSTHGWSIIFF